MAKKKTEEEKAVEEMKEIVAPLKKTKKKKKENVVKRCFKCIGKGCSKLGCAIKKKLHVSTTMKKWGVISWVCVILLTGAFVIMYCQHPDWNYSEFTLVVSLAWAEVAVYNGCYCIKEKSENRLKIAYGFINDMADKYGIEAITPILQSIIQD